MNGFNELQRRKHSDYVPIDANPFCNGCNNDSTNEYDLASDEEMQTAKAYGWPFPGADVYWMSQLDAMTRSAVTSLVKNACKSAFGCSKVIIHYECGQNHDGTPFAYGKCGTTETYDCDCNEQEAK